MKLRKSALICGIISAMIIGFVFRSAIKEERCWYSMFRHYKNVVSSYARQVFSS